MYALQGFLEDDDDHNYVALKRERMSDTETAQWVEMIPKVVFLFNCVSAIGDLASLQLTKDSYVILPPLLYYLDLHQIEPKEAILRSKVP